MPHFKFKFDIEVFNLLFNGFTFVCDGLHLPKGGDCEVP
jgi:hypothetical protein